MRFFLQMGYGMLSMNRDLLTRYAAGADAGVIVWPRTTDPQQALSHAQDVHRLRGSVLFDSCFYAPRSEHARITSFPYWPSADAYDTTEFTAEAGRQFAEEAIRYQVETLRVTEILLPGSFVNTIDQQWLDTHRQFAEAGAKAERGGRRVFSTVAIGEDLIVHQQSFDRLINELTTFPVDGVYFLYRSPNGQYLTTNDVFLLNLLIGFLSLSLAGKEIIIGYANQQDLIFAAAGVGTIASGNFRNVRRFNPAIFEEQEAQDLSRKTWFYDGNSMSEFRTEQLDIAYHHLGMRGRFGPRSPEADVLLDAINPSQADWPERSSFMHFLQILREQWIGFAQVPRNRRAAAASAMVHLAAQQITGYRNSRFALGQRSAADALPIYADVLEQFQALETDRIAEL
ncbi:hypothetical protein [Limnoglobus roseus]|uniref:Uncharacterized protein n=1 Tax=Limnoglobus roseus TaxID=2598579 RepID=A0A5C1ANC6_9BACT|nr:hypothetical protein [Limnoglobus roseus]QEL19232.1 hypothetical protein PX52LOC_06294 [Limnoglobus roseus]